MIKSAEVGETLVHDTLGEGVVTRVHSSYSVTLKLQDGSQSVVSLFRYLTRKEDEDD